MARTLTPAATNFEHNFEGDSPSAPELTAWLSNTDQDSDEAYRRLQKQQKHQEEAVCGLLVEMEFSPVMCKVC